MQSIAPRRRRPLMVRVLFTSAHSEYLAQHDTDHFAFFSTSVFSSHIHQQHTTVSDHTPKVPCTSERTSQIRKRVASPQSPSSIRNPVSEASTHILLNASHSLRRSREVSEDAPTPNPDVITDLYNNEKLLVGLESNTDQGSSSLFPERTAAPLFEWVHMIVAFLFSIRSVYSLSLLIVDSEDESTGVSPSFSQLLSRLGTVQDIHVETPTVYGWGMVRLDLSVIVAWAL